MHTSAVKSGWVTNGPNQLNYLEWGHPGKPALVLIHGIRGFAYTWRTVAERLQDRYHLIALNLRGHGDSGPSPERDYTFDLYASDVHALAEELGLNQFTIVGHSLGGRVAIAYAAQHPERSPAIVVVDIAPGLTDAGAWGIKRGMEATPAEFDSWEAAIAYAQQTRAGSARELVAERSFYQFRSLPSGTVTWKHDPLVREEWLGPDLPPRAKAHLWNELERLRVPMLLIKGEQTPQLTAEISDRMVSFRPGNRWVEIPGTTHFVHDDNLDGFLAVIEPYLAEHARQPVA